MIETFIKKNRPPFSHSDLPPFPDTVEPIVLVGDEVTIQGVWSGPDVAGKVVDVSPDGGSVWVDVKPVITPGGGPAVVAVHRIETIKRGDETWTRPAEGRL
jgi:hypothetical protein